MAEQQKILAHVSLPIGEAQIVDWHWPSPMEAISCEDRHMIEMSLPPLATDGTGCFPEIAPGRFSHIGNVFLRPAGIRLYSRSNGGHIRIVRLAIEQECYESTTGHSIDAKLDILRLCLDLRDDRPRALLKRMYEELINPGFAGAALLEAYGTALVIETARSIAAHRERYANRGRLAGWQYRRVCERIEAEGPAPTLAELAALCGVSIRHFVRLYRALTGESVTAHLVRSQVARAAVLLKDDSLPLKQVAARLGFAHPGSFSAAFRRATGMSPSQYRQQAGWRR